MGQAPEESPPADEYSDSLVVDDDHVPYAGDVLAKEGSSCLVSPTLIKKDPCSPRCRNLATEEGDRAHTHETGTVQLNGSTFRSVTILQAAVMILLLISAILVCAGVYVYTKRGEEQKYEQQYEDDATKMTKAFEDAVQRRLGAINSLANQITSYALDTNTSFPFVTLPNFAVRGADLRIQADAVIVHWMPLVTDGNRVEWEQYAMDNRFHIDEAYEEDKDLRDRQDVEFGFCTNADNCYRRLEHHEVPVLDPSKFKNETILDDGTGYHPKIWSVGAVLPRADFPNQTGPYLPLWQRSPVSEDKQELLNLDFASTRVIGRDVFQAMLSSEQAIMNRAVFPAPTGLELFEATVKIGQYRHEENFSVADPLTFIIYPVFDSFLRDRKISGALATNIYWTLFFKNILQSSSTRLICVLENSFNQTFSYIVEGSDASYIGNGDAHEDRFDYLEMSAEINTGVDSLAGPTSRAYSSVPLNNEFGSYTLKIYPEDGPEHSNNPLVYTLVVAATFVFTSIIYVLFIVVVEKRQKMVMTAALLSAEKAAMTAQELNEFLSHEVRNPLSAAISASVFVKTAVLESPHIVNEAFRLELKDDVQIIVSSLSFINDFLRSMLDLHRAAGKQMIPNLSPTDLMIDVLEPVSNMFYQKNTSVTIEVDCPPGIVMMSDSLRLKQVILNLGRNSAKFVESGFIRFRGRLVGRNVEILVEDSGPGIPPEKRADLFRKFQTSLDSLGQGTGLGLSLCKALVDLLGGELFLDENYRSGIKDSPGARFVIRFPQSKMEVTPEASDDLEAYTPSTPSDVTSKTERSTMELPSDLRVLFVDDDLLLRKLFFRAVRRVAPTWNINEAASGESALAMVDEESFDLIFMDQYMAAAEKQLLGTETVRALRAKGVTSIICGLSANDLEPSFVAAGADAFIMKPMPCEKVELNRELKRVIESQTY